MWRVLAAVARNLQSTKKSSKVADESMLEGANGVEIHVFGHENGRRGHGGFSIIHSILQAPISILSCVSHPRVNGSDGIWVTTGEFSQISEMNHLMVSDSMRYAILM
ncbi:uncharacterized protein LOC130939292 [Arachis stenosperma]|uniref:uncharacterized protein LOC130939292 n=1 Tax=Arachis stenosperma TaxID=217475 RepID=UPI0025ABDFBE|nr:uncharacterized protein LOC130939292 [Arachis stenosperma]